MRPRFTVDVATFQRMLAAAWVLQCQRDQEISNCRDRAIPVAGPSHDEEVIALASPADCLSDSSALAGPDELQVLPPAPDPVPRSLPISPVWQRPEASEALALSDGGDSLLASDLPSARLSDVTSVASVERKAATVWMRIKFNSWPFPRQIRVAIPRLAAIEFKRAWRTAAASAEPLLVLLILVAFLLAVPRRDFAPTPLRAATQNSHTRASELIARAVTDPVPSSASASGESGTDHPVPGLGPSHLQVTDLATSSTVQALSRYELQGLRHRAQFGDELAALTLGMAYETGRYVPQSCSQAAYWVGIAAAGGNAAAQYNLAQRYLHGDGLTADLEEARKWLQKAAGHGYPKAESVLQSRGE